VRNVIPADDGHAKCPEVFVDAKQQLTVIRASWVRRRVVSVLNLEPVPSKSKVDCWQLASLCFTTHPVAIARVLGVSDPLEDLGADEVHLGLGCRQGCPARVNDGQLRISFVLLRRCVSEVKPVEAALPVGVDCAHHSDIDWSGVCLPLGHVSRAVVDV